MKSSLDFDSKHSKKCYSLVVVNILCRIMFLYAKIALTMRHCYMSSNTNTSSYLLEVMKNLFGLKKGQNFNLRLLGSEQLRERCSQNKNNILLIN